MKRKTLRIIVPVWFVAFLVPLVSFSAEEPIAEIAVISNPYITTLPADEIRDESGSLRDFLAKTAPDGMEKTVALVNSLQPDALVVLGSLTWNGSDSDFAAIAEYLDRVNAPKFIVPGHRNRLSGSLDGYLRAFGKHDARDSVKSVNDVTLAFTGDLHTVRMRPSADSTRNCLPVNRPKQYSCLLTTTARWDVPA